VPLRSVRSPRAGHGVEPSGTRRAVELVFAVGWAAFWLYWIVAARSTTRGRVSWSRELAVRAVIVALALVLTRLGAFRGHGLTTDPWRAALGVIGFAVGLGFAGRARVHVRHHWGVPMARTERPGRVRTP